MLGHAKVSKQCFLSCPDKCTTRLGLEVKFLTTASEGETRNKSTEFLLLFFFFLLAHFLSFIFFQDVRFCLMGYNDV